MDDCCGCNEPASFEMFAGSPECCGFEFDPLVHDVTIEVDGRQLAGVCITEAEYNELFAAGKACLRFDRHFFRLVE